MGQDAVSVTAGIVDMTDEQPLALHGLVRLEKKLTASTTSRAASALEALRFGLFRGSWEDAEIGAAG
eukprot:s4023_g1.t1